jgi:acetyltransferase-like isoleucine patch superfamily enzyme
VVRHSSGAAGAREAGAAVARTKHSIAATIAAASAIEGPAASRVRIVRFVSSTATIVTEKLRTAPARGAVVGDVRPVLAPSRRAVRVAVATVRGGIGERTYTPGLRGQAFSAGDRSVQECVVKGHRREAAAPADRSLLEKVLKALGCSLSERRWAMRRYLEEREGYRTEPLVRGRCSYGEPLITRFPVDVGGVEDVYVGSFVSIGADVVLQDGGSHPVDWVTTFPLRVRLGLPGAYGDGHPRSKGNTVIGNDVWIGRGARVLSGVRIGDGAVVGAYSVVTKDVSPYTIVGGNPAREIRKRFSDEQIAALRAIAWWNWPMEKIVDCVGELSDPDIDAFIARHRAHVQAPL